VRGRQYTSDDASNPGSSSAAPIATFQRALGCPAAPAPASLPLHPR